jgi:hypothetical protein
MQARRCSRRGQSHQSSGAEPPMRGCNSTLTKARVLGLVPVPLALRTLLAGAAVGEAGLVDDAHALHRKQFQARCEGEGLPVCSSSPGRLCSQPLWIPSRVFACSIGVLKCRLPQRASPASIYSPALSVPPKGPLSPLGPLDREKEQESPSGATERDERPSRPKILRNYLSFTQNLLTYTYPRSCASMRAIADSPVERKNKKHGGLKLTRAGASSREG